MRDYVEQNARSDRGADYAGYIRTHSVHKKEVAGIFLLTYAL